MGYDAAGRVLQVSHSDGTGASFEYDARGQLLRALNESADVRIERDALGRIVAESQDGGQTWVRSRYGAGGERASVRSDLGARQDIEVDALGEVAALIHGGGVPGSGAPARIGFERNAAGLEVARELPGGVRVAWTRDKLGRPLERQTTRRRGPGGTAVEVLDARSYQWRGADQIGAIIDAATGPRFYDHDRRGRLIRERRPDATIERAMDAVGNVYRRSDRGDRRYGPGGRLEEADSTRYEHDPDGNQTLRVEPDGSRWTYRWNGAGMLSEVVRPDDSRVRFGYDAFARRVSKQVVTAADDGTETIESETRFVWYEHNVLHELGSDAPPTTWYWEPDTFTPVMKRQADAWRSVATDHLGTPTEMYDEVGELAWSMQLDVFGVPRFGAGEAGDCPWRWPGQYEDGETGEYYNRHRYYATATAVYSACDPLFAPIETGYGYCPDPSAQTDPLGLHVVSAFFTPAGGTRSALGNPALGGANRWPNLIGSGRNGMAPSGFGRLGDSENQLLEHLAQAEPDRPLGGGVLEVVSTPAHGSPLPPCDLCGEGMQRFADTYRVTVVYTETGARGRLPGEPRIYRPTCG